MTTILVDKTPVIIGEKNIVEFTVGKIGMLAFHKLAQETNSMVPNGGKQWALHNKRLRIRHQVRAISETGDKVSLSDMDISQMPIVYAKQINAEIANDPDKAGEIVNSGDGVTSPILFRLGTPIKAQINSEVSAITELEFLAHTFGDVEEVLAEVDNLSQGVALIRSVAKPLGMNDTLQRLPEWALEKFTLADTFKIIEVVLPRFLE